MAETLIVDNAEYQVFEEVTAKGRTQRIAAKPGSTMANQQALADKLVQAIAANDAYVAIVSPTNAQVAAQVQRLTKECSALFRLMLGQLDTTAGT